MLLLAQMEAEMEAKMLQAMPDGMVPYFGLDCLMVDCFLPHWVLRIQMIRLDFHHWHLLRFGSCQCFREKCL